MVHRVYAFVLVLVASYGISLACVLRMLKHMFVAPHPSKKYIIADICIIFFFFKTKMGGSAI